MTLMIGKIFRFKTRAHKQLYFGFNLHFFGQKLQIHTFFRFSVPWRVASLCFAAAPLLGCLHLLMVNNLYSHHEHSLHLYDHFLANYIFSWWTIFPYIFIITSWRTISFSDEFFCKCNIFFWNCKSTIFTTNSIKSASTKNFKVGIKSSCSG